MKEIRDLIPLHDNRPGIRSLLQVEVREALACEPESGGAAATLDFVASTATLDRHHEIIEPAGWRLDSYRRNPVFQNAHLWEAGRIIELSRPETSANRKE